MGLGTLYPVRRGLQRLFFSAETQTGTGPCHDVGRTAAGRSVRASASGRIGRSAGMVGRGTVGRSTQSAARGVDHRFAAPVAELRTDALRTAHELVASTALRRSAERTTTQSHRAGVTDSGCSIFAVHQRAASTGRTAKSRSVIDQFCSSPSRTNRTSVSAATATVIITRFRASG